MTESLKRKKIRVLAASLSLLLLSAAGGEYWKRVILWNWSDVQDYRRFPAREIKNAPPVFNFDKDTDALLVERAFSRLDFEHKRKRDTIDEFLEATLTTAFIVIRGDVILYEKYFNGYSRDSINTSFSVAKSFDSALVGIAIDEGRIKSVDEPVTNYIPELAGRGLEKVTIRDLLCMSSGLEYIDLRDEPLTYYYPDLREAALGVKLDHEPGSRFLYNNYNPLLIGLILERATGVPVAKYLEEKIWKRIGAEFPASYSLDSEESGFEKMESGINARSIDFAKVGRLFLRKGDWDGERIISEDWVVESTTRDRGMEVEGYYRHFDAGPDYYYKYFWWGLSNDDGTYDYSAIGHHGQYIFVSNRRNIVMVRNGIKDGGDVFFWPLFFRMLADEL